MIVFFFSNKKRSHPVEAAPPPPVQENAEQNENAENAEHAENLEQPAIVQNATTQHSQDEDESDTWEETFKTHTDSKPNGT